MTPDDPRITLAAELLPIACELIGCVRDYSVDDTAAILARVPDGRHDALAVVLAAMVDPDAKAGDLLAWTEVGLEYHRLVAAGVHPGRANYLAKRVA